MFNTNTKFLILLRYEFDWIWQVLGSEMSIGPKSSAVLSPRDWAWPQEGKV